MVSDRQIAANRRNACRSTGPRSRAGRQRSSRNSFRHGLASGAAANTEVIERLARKIAGKNSDVLTLECATTIAQAEFELRQIRRSKAALISWVMAFGRVELQGTLPSLRLVKRFIKQLVRGEQLVPPERADAPQMPTTEPERTTEAIRRALPELTKLERYERRAAGRRARALCSFLEHKKYKPT